LGKGKAISKKKMFAIASIAIYFLNIVKAKINQLQIAGQLLSPRPTNK
jgi:hypothetical protein